MNNNNGSLTTTGCKGTAKCETKKEGQGEIAPSRPFF